MPCGDVRQPQVLRPGVWPGGDCAGGAGVRGWGGGVEGASLQPAEARAGSLARPTTSPPPPRGGAGTGRRAGAAAGDPDVRGRGAAGLGRHLPVPDVPGGRTRGGQDPGTPAQGQRGGRAPTVCVCACGCACMCGCGCAGAAVQHALCVCAACTSVCARGGWGREEGARERWKGGIRVKEAVQRKALACHPRAYASGRPPNASPGAWRACFIR